MAEKLGVPRSRMLDGLHIPDAVFASADARLSMLQANNLLYRGMKLTSNPGFGYEIGLHSGLTTHGFLGYGLLSNATLRTAVDFGSRFLALRLPNLSLHVFTDGAQGVIEAHETLALGAVRQCMYDLFLVGLWRMVPVLGTDLNAARQQIELWFDYPEPDYARRYRTRLPALRFAAGANQLRLPAYYLDLPHDHDLPLLPARLVTHQCEQELTQLGYRGDIAAQVRALLADAHDGYPGLDTVAARLRLSTRTLKRRLQERGLGYQQLLDEARRRDALRLLGDATLSIEQIALRLGYSDPANFTRAFRKWAGRSPSAQRQLNARE